MDLQALDHRSYTIFSKTARKYLPNLHEVNDYPAILSHLLIAHPYTVRYCNIFIGAAQLYSCYISLALYQTSGLWKGLMKMQLIHIVGLVANAIFNVIIANSLLSTPLITVSFSNRLTHIADKTFLSNWKLIFQEKGKVGEPWWISARLFCDLMRVKEMCLRNIIQPCRSIPADPLVETQPESYE